MRLGGEASGRRPLELRVLGPVEVWAEGARLTVGGQRQRALLAVLLLRANRVVPRAELIDALWGEQPPASAANAIQVAVHGLRQALGAERLETHGSGYRISVAPGELDLERFEQLSAAAVGETSERRAELLREALGLWRGPALADLDGVPFVDAERERLEELRTSAVERRIEADLERGAARELIPELEGLVVQHPYREELRAQLMLALYRSGRQADALEEYRRARSTLVEELGVEPSRRLQELESAILRQDAALDATAPVARPQTNLPAPTGPLIGRALELAAITALVRADDGRLVTLTGPGGTGKTRLALAAALELQDELDGGVWFADLGSLPDAELVGSTVARTLGVRDPSDDALVERIGSGLAGRETLLVVDNFEHLLAAAAFVSELVARVPSLRVLATSREPLRVRAEREYRVPPLGLPDAGATATAETVGRAEAVELFVARAQAARPDFELTEQNAQSVVGVCRALDGLPLALELAAPRVKLLSPAMLLDRLSDRLGALAAGERDLPPRQRTLRAAIDWSYDLLAPGEQALLSRLSVFSGGFGVGAAEAVCGADLEGLGSLVEKSLVQAGGSTDAPRFSMLETVREYALERLAESGEAAAIRDRHADHFARLAEALEPDLHTRAALDQAELEHDNVRAALGHSLSSGAGDPALRLTALARFWYVRGFQHEGRGWIEQALAAAGGSHERRVPALYWSAVLAWRTGDVSAAVARGRESLDLARSLGDDRGTMMALTTLGLAHFGAGDLLAARDFHTRSLEVARRLGRRRETARSLANLADIAFLLNEYGLADELASESLTIADELGDHELRGVALLVLAASALETGRFDEAAPLAADSLRSFHHVDFRDYLASSLVALARALTPAEAPLAGRLLGAARTIRAPLGPSQFPWEQSWFDGTVVQLRAALGGVPAEAELEAGADDPSATIEEALVRSA